MAIDKMGTCFNKINWIYGEI